MKRRTNIQSIMDPVESPFPAPIQTLADLTDSIANILYIYGAEDRSGWEEWCYRLLIEAARIDVYGIDQKELRLEYMLQTRLAINRLFECEKPRIIQGGINEDAFARWILEYVIVAYKNYLNHSFKCSLKGERHSSDW